MPRYAAETSVPVEKSKAEIERTLMRYGADGFSYAWEGNRSQVAFRIGGKMVRFWLTLPDRDAEEFRLTPSKKWERSAPEQQKAWEQACRQRWRALGLKIKADLEAMEAGILTLEEAFLPHIVLPNRATVGEWLIPQVEQAYLTGEMPKMLPEGRQDG